MRARCRIFGVAAILLSLLGGCSRFEERPAPIAAPDARAHPLAATAPGGGEPLSRYGNPEFYEVLGKRYVPLKSARGFTERGIASWYGPDFHGKRTSTHETYDMYQMTAAHKLLPLPTLVEVTNLENGRRAILRVNDRGPFKDNRIIDLSYAAAVKLGVYERGTAFVEVRALGQRPAVSSEAVGQKSMQAPESPRMYLQIGAFGELANAERLKSRVSAGLPEQVRIFEDGAAPRPLYKVQVGPIVDVEHADALVATLAGFGINQHHFISN